MLAKPLAVTSAQWRDCGS